MSFAWDITIPANTLPTSPVEQILKLHPGIITKIEIEGAAGQHRLVKVRIFRSTWQLVPYDPDTWVSLDFFPVIYDTYIDITHRPHEVRFIAHSEGTFYSHKVTVRITVLPEKVASMLPLMKVISKLIEVFETFLKRIGVIK